MTLITSFTKRSMRAFASIFRFSLRKKSREASCFTVPSDSFAAVDPADPPDERRREPRHVQRYLRYLSSGRFL